MEGCDHLFQLDEDDIFNNDSFLEELEVVEKLERNVSNHKQTPSPHGPQQSSFSKSNLAPPSMPRIVSSVIPQAKTPDSGKGRRFSFKSKTSPDIPLPPSFSNHKHRDSSISIGDKIGGGGKQNCGLTQLNVGHERNTFKGRKDLGTRESSAKSNNPSPRNATKISPPLANSRQLNSNPFRPDTGSSKQGSEVHKKSVENVLDTSLGDFREPPCVAGSHKSAGILRPVGSTAQNSKPHVPRQEVSGDSTGTSCNTGQRHGVVGKHLMRSPPQGSYPPHQQDSSRTTHKPPATPSSSKVSPLSHDRCSNSAPMNTPTSGSNFCRRQMGPAVQQRNQNAIQSPNVGSPCNFSPDYNQRGGTSSVMRTPQSRTGVSSYDQTPPPAQHRDRRYATPNGSLTPGNPVRTPNVHGRGKQQHTQEQYTPTMGHAQRYHTPRMGHAQQQHTPTMGHAQQQHTPTMGHAQRYHSPRMGHAQQQHTPTMGHAQQQHTPTMGHAQRHHPQTNRPLPNHRQSTPGQPSRPVLTPRVAQLCKGSGPSPGASAVHGGARKFPGPAGMLPKLSPGQKLKDAAAALKKKVEEEELSQEVEDSSEEVADVGDFEHGAWDRMKTELGIKDRDPNSILQQNNIALVIRKASLKQLTKNKVNHLCVMIKTISLNSSDASVSLCDPSGEMHGTIHRRLIEEYQGDLRPGSVLVLRQVGVLSPSQRNHYLNITPSNLIQVFAGESTSRPGSQRTPKRTRKRSGKTPSRKKHPSGKASPEVRAEPSALDESPAASRRHAEDDGLGLGDAPVTMDTDNYVEDDDAGIWEVMLDDDDDDDLLIQDSLVGQDTVPSKPSSREDEEIVSRNEMNSKNSESTHSSALSSSKPGTTQNSLARLPSPNSSSMPSPLTTISSSTSSRVLPLATKRCHPVPSKPTPCTLGNLEEKKRPCLRDISGLGSNTGGGNQMGGSTKGQKPALNSCREEIIGDLLEGLEDELFDDF